MIDTKELETRIAATGKTKSYLAKKMGITIQTLRLKMKNQSDFTTTQVDVLCNELNITKLTDKEKIFFAK